MSVGWAGHPDDGGDAGTLLDAADGRLNAGKRELRRARRWLGSGSAALPGPANGGR